MEGLNGLKSGIDSESHSNWIVLAREGYAYRDAFAFSSSYDFFLPESI